MNRKSLAGPKGLSLKQTRTGWKEATLLYAKGMDNRALDSHFAPLFIFQAKKADFKAKVRSVPLVGAILLGAGTRLLGPGGMHVSIFPMHFHTVSFKFIIKI